MARVRIHCSCHAHIELFVSLSHLSCLHASCVRCAALPTFRDPRALFEDPRHFCRWKHLRLSSDLTHPESEGTPLLVRATNFLKRKVVKAKSFDQTSPPSLRTHRSPIFPDHTTHPHRRSASSGSIHVHSPVLLPWNAQECTLCAIACMIPSGCAVSTHS